MTEISESDTLKKIKTLEKLIMEVGDANVIGLFSILMKFADNKTGKCFPSQRTIRELAKFGSNNTLNKYLKVLIEHGYVNKVSNKASGEANIYYLNWLGAEATNSETNTPRQKMTTPSSNNEHPPSQILQTELYPDSNSSFFNSNREEKEISSSENNSTKPQQQAVNHEQRSYTSPKRTHTEITAHNDSIKNQVAQRLLARGEQSRIGCSRSSSSTAIGFH